jgi:hypothetical protein
MKKSQFSFGVALCFSAVIGTTRAAQAQSGSVQKAADAQTIYDAAVEAMDSKDYVHACPMLEEVMRLAPEGVGAKLTLAECYEASGKLASAWTIYTLVEAATAGKVGQIERKKLARKRAEALKPKLAQLTIVVPPSTRSIVGLEIQRDGGPVGSAQWDIASPADTGDHVVTATAAGKRKWQKTITIAANGSTTSVDVDGLEDEVVATPAPPVSLREKPVTPPALPAPLEPRGTTQRILGIVTASAGLASIGVGSVFGVLALNKKSDSNAGPCMSSGECDTAGIQLRAEGRTAATTSTIFFIAGGVGLVGGITLFVLAPRGVKPVDSKIAFGPRGIEIRGTW